MKKIALFMLLLIMSSGVIACKTQASIKDGEPMTCYQARYLAREGFGEASAILATECTRELKRDWCLKVLAERPDIFKDFNDCWRQ